MVRPSQREAPGSIDDDLRRDRPGRCHHPTGRGAAFQHPGHRAGRSRTATPTERARSRSSASKSARQTWNPCHDPALSLPNRLEPARAAPLDPEPVVARADDLRQPRGDAELREQRLHAWMKRLTRSVSRRRVRARRARRAGHATRRRSPWRCPCGAAACDDYVGIEVSICHRPSSRWISVVLPDT